MPGNRIGLDIVIVDKDSGIDTPPWICWAPAAEMKMLNADQSGDLVLVQNYADLSSIVGTVTHKKEKPLRRPNH